MNTSDHAGWLLLLAATTAGAAEYEVIVTGSGAGFEPASLTIAVGDEVTWRNTAGHHHIRAEDDSFRNDFGPGHSPDSWELTHRFDRAGTYPYYCTVHSAPGVGENGVIIVSGEDEPPPEEDAFTINEGVAGSWYDPANPGQGLLFEAADGASVFALAWFTWRSDGGGHDWLVGSGEFAGDTAAVVLFRVSGGLFNHPAPVETQEAGTALVTFEDCSNARFLFELGPEASGEIPLVRILPPSQRCLAANPQEPPAAGAQ